MREALSSAAHLPFQVAAAITDEMAHQVEELGSSPRHEANQDVPQLYHEDSTQMRFKDQHSDTKAAASSGAAILEEADDNADEAARNAEVAACGREVRGEADKSRQEADRQCQESGATSAGTSSEQSNLPKPLKCVKFLNQEEGLEGYSSAARAASRLPTGQESAPRQEEGNRGGNQAAQPGSPTMLSDSGSQETSLSSSVSTATLETKRMLINIVFVRHAVIFCINISTAHPPLIHVSLLMVPLIVLHTCKREVFAMTLPCNSEVANLCLLAWP